MPIPGKLLSLRLKKYQIDKAHKDKACKSFPDNFSVTLFLVKPDDQSEKLLDYSLLPPQILMNMGGGPGPAPGDFGVGGGAEYATITSGMPTSIGGTTSIGAANSKFTVEAVQSQKTRERPLTGGSGASSSSATPSLKSTEQSSQDSVNSSDDEKITTAGDTNMFRTFKNSNNSTTCLKKQPPASTAI